LIFFFLVYFYDIFHLHVAPQYRDFGTIVRNSEALDRVDFIRTAFRDSYFKKVSITK
jgi:hypothetical protein